MEKNLSWDLKEDKLEKRTRSWNEKQKEQWTKQREVNREETVVEIKKKMTEIDDQPLW